MLKVALSMYSMLESDSFKSTKDTILNGSSILHYGNSKSPIREILAADVLGRTIGKGGEVAGNLKEVGNAIGILPCLGVSTV